MNVALGVLMEMLWPLVAAGVTFGAWDAWRRYLAREATAVRELKAELKATHEDWEKRFTKYERAHDQLVTRFNATNPSPNPLGKHYSTRSAG